MYTLYIFSYYPNISEQKVSAQSLKAICFSMQFSSCKRTEISYFKKNVINMFIMINNSILFIPAQFKKKQ